MKKLLFILPVLLLVILYSCRKNLMPRNDINAAGNGKFGVAQARDHIKALVRGDVAFDGKIPLKLMSINGAATPSAAKPKTIKTGQKIFYPFWDRAITASFKGKVDYVEVPIAMSSRQIRLYQFKKDNIKLKPDAIVANSVFQRLVIYKTRNGKIGQRLLTYIPDKQYIREHGYEASTNSLQKLNRDFFGYIEYKNWSGAIVAVLRIENGKVVRKYKLGNKGTNAQLNGVGLQAAKSNAQGKVMEGSTQEEQCDWVWVPIMETVCEVNDDGNPNDENLNEIECTLTEVGETQEWVCEWVDVPDPDPNPSGDCDEEDQPCDEGGGGGEEEQPETPADIKDKLDDECLKNVWDSIKNNTDSKITKLLDSTFGINDSINFIIVDENISSGAPAKSQVMRDRYDSNGKHIFDVKVTLNKNTMPGYSQEFVATTIVHEIMHSYFNANKVYFNQQFQQHQAMAEGYVESLKEAVTDMFEDMPDKDAYALIMNGFNDMFENNLTGWNALLAKYNLTNQEIYHAQQAYKSSAPNSPGTKCPPKMSN